MDYCGRMHRSCRASYFIYYGEFHISLTWVQDPIPQDHSHESFLLCTLPGFLSLLMCSTFSSSYPFSPSSCCSRKMFPQGLPFPSPITLWSPPLPSLPPSHLCPLTAPLGYAAWASMMVTLMLKIPSERYLGVSAPV